jgi:CubicO group peptidase (beta-lactamase class C family)
MPTSTPSSEGVDAAGVEAFIDRVGTTDGVELHSLMLLRHGSLVAAGWWAPYSAGRAHLLYSLSKSFASSAAGVALGEGLLALDDPVIAYFPELEAEVTDPRSRSMRVRDIAAMASGHLAETWDRVLADDHDDPVRAFLRLPPDRDPGSVFAYNQSATYTLAAIVQKVSGETLTSYLRPRLFDPLGIGPVSWIEHPPGREIGFSGLHATTADIARLGQLYLQGGSWQGRQLLPAQFVADATRRQVATSSPGNPSSDPDWALGYGFQFWVSRHGYRADGAYGQFCLVLPEQDAVVAMTGQSADTQALLDAVWSELLPAMHDTPLVGSERADRRLRERLAALALPARRGEPKPADDEAWAASFIPSAASAEEQPSLERAELGRDGGDWRLVLLDGGARYELPVPGERWSVATQPGGPPLACSGGWVAPELFRLDVAFLETPHRLEISCRLPAGELEAKWATMPLHPHALRSMRAPGAAGWEDQPAR